MYTFIKMGGKKSTYVAKNKQKPTSLWNRHKLLWKWLIGIFGSTLLLVLAVYIAFQVSPWPNSLLIRYGFDKQDAKVAAALEKHVPSGIASADNQEYRPNDSDGFLDVFYPEETTAQLPTVVWVHGGAWVSGDKNDVDNYLKIIASYGYVAVGVDYGVAPEHQYPLPILQLNDALDYLQKNASRLHINPNKIVLAGDSAGSQIVAQMATIVTSPSYANAMNVSPALSADKLKGTLLNCGAYNLALPDYSGPFGSFLHTVLWAYSGTADFMHDPKLKTASVVNYVTKDFPPSFITAGNIDPLLDQSTEFAKKLQSLGVPTSTLFYPTDHQPQLNHEYQFNLDTDDGKQALQQMINFIQQRTN